VSVKITVITSREFPALCSVYDASVVRLHSVDIHDYEAESGGRGGGIKPYVRKYKDP
jgi:hypothetical protein